MTPFLQRHVLLLCPGQALARSSLSSTFDPFLPTRPWNDSSLRNAILPCKSVVWRAKPTRKVSMWTDGLGINPMSCRRAFCVLTRQKSSLPKRSRAHGSNKRLYLLPRHSSFRERSRHLWIIPHLRPRGCAFARAESRLG
ncbi:hypothetical protein BKA81DRAFT_55469 [Phyllosticta paracitricarpa]